jgi:hypothetical protein
LARTLYRMEGDVVVMPHARVPLSGIELLFIRFVDGRRTIREIAALVVAEPAWQHGAAVIEDLARKAFQNLWRLDFLAMARTPARPTN